MSVQQRVTLMSALAAALGGALAVLVAGTLSQRMVTEHENARVTAAAQLLADEVEEELSDADDDDDIDEAPGPRTLSVALPHELEDDVRIPGARAAVRGVEASVVGDAALPALTAGTCEEHLVSQVPLRLCAVPFRGGTLTLGVDDVHALEQRALFWWSLAFGLLAGALAGGLSSFWIARWTVRPLVRLGAQVRAIDPEDPSAAPLGGSVPEEEIETLRRSVADLVERLRESLLVARAFAADASHELRSPLAAVAGELELLEERTVGADRLALSRARERVRGLAGLVERLLVLVRPEAEEGNEAVDVEEVVQLAVHALPKAHAPRVVVRTEGDLVVRGDATLLTAMVSNALDNALKFSPGAVRVVGELEGDELVLRIQDEGPGIPDGERERVFQPFVRGRARSAPGHGIGLALIDRVARVHHGRVAFVDAERGARLEIRLPAWRIRDAD